MWIKVKAKGDALVQRLRADGAIIPKAFVARDVDHSPLADGEWVEQNSHYVRAVLAGDLEQVGSPAALPGDAAKPARTRGEV